MRSSSIAAIFVASAILAAGAVGHASVFGRQSPARSSSAGNADLNSIKTTYQDRSYGFLTRSGGQFYHGAAPDFLLSDRGGAKFSRAASIRHANAAMSALSGAIGSASDPQALTYTFDILSAAFSGGQAIVIVSGQVRALSVSDASASTYASAAAVFNGVYRDVWVRTPQGWLQKSSHKL